MKWIFIFGRPETELILADSLHKCPQKPRQYHAKARIHEFYHNLPHGGWRTRWLCHCLQCQRCILAEAGLDNSVEVKCRHSDTAGGIPRGILATMPNTTLSFPLAVTIFEEWLFPQGLSQVSLYNRVAVVLFPFPAPVFSRIGQSNWFLRSPVIVGITHLRFLDHRPLHRFQLTPTLGYYKLILFGKGVFRSSEGHIGLDPILI